jgi:hypothetical protein
MAMIAASSAVNAPVQATTAEPGDDRRGHRGRREQEAHPADHVDACRHHGGRVDERGDRCRTGHRVGQPDVERNLRRLPAGAHEQTQSDQVDELKRRPRERNGHGQPGDRLEVLADVGKGERRGHAHVHEGLEDQEDPDQEAEVPDPVHDEGLAPAEGVVAVAVPEADQQVGAEAHALPAQEQEHQVVGQHEHEHREREQVHVAEEALEPPIVPMVVVHVADGVDVDQEAHTRHHQDHHRRERPAPIHV